jgi:hypothetical protein
MKKMDMAVARSLQQIVLLVTMGTDPDKGGVNQKNLEAMQNLFTNQSVGRVLIADYTTKAQFVIPEIGNLMGPEKYEVVDRDILVGLNNILIGNDKFANGSMKVQVFIERLKQSRESFLNNFLYPEVRRISRDLGFKNYPTPFFEDIDLKDDVQYSRIYTRLMELGILLIVVILISRLMTQLLHQMEMVKVVVNLPVVLKVVVILGLKEA